MLTICKEILDQLVAHAIKHYPDESCGFLIGDKGKDSASEFLPVNNAYDEMHTRHPETYPRTARNAYLIDPRLQQQIFDDAAANGREVKAIYHSHTDHDAYFSDEDKLVAAPWGEPMFPGVAYVVVSIWNRKLKEINEFTWNDIQKGFVERRIKCP